MLDLSNIIAIAYVVYSYQSVVDVIQANKFNPIKYIKTIMGCDKCLSFWLVWLVSQDLQLALLTSFAVLLMQSFIVTKL